MRAGLLIALAVFACKKEAPPAPEPTPPTAAEAEAFAKKVAVAAQACDTKELDWMLDVDRLLDRAVAGRRMSSDEDRGMRTGFKRTFGGKSLCTIGDAAKSASYQWIHHAPGSGNPIIRMLSDQGINYLELVLDKQDGNIRIVDFYPYTLGELMSHAVAAMIDTASTEDAGKLTIIKQYMANNEPKQALATIRDLPRDWRDSKPVMLMELTASGQIGDDAAYLAAIEKFSKTFPNDPALDLVEIDGAFLRKEFKRELEILDRLDRHIGGDPYLDSMRANAYAELGELPKAVEHAKRAAQKVPEIQEVWWGLLSFQAATEDFAGAIQTLNQLRDHFKAKLDGLDSDNRFSKLVASKEYLAWLGAAPAPTKK